MKKHPLYCILFLFAVAFIGAPLNAAAAVAGQKDVLFVAASGSMPDRVDTEQPSKQDDKQGKNKKRDQKPDVKEVPKSRRQPKPASVKPKVKIKTPVKKIKPVIKRNLGLINKNLGI